MNAATFFNPQGRMSKGQFQAAFLVLVVLGFINALSPLVPGAAAAMAVGSLSFFVGLVIAYMWVAIWIKRLHNGNITGWMTILIVFGWFIISMVISTTIQIVMAPEAFAPSSGGSFAEIMAASQETARQVAVPSAIAGAVVSGVYAFLLNAVLKTDPEENRFGPAPQ
jgi:uncharacterized membrane protein YhaH (DUF805 family)